MDRVQLHLLWIKVILNVSTGHFWGEMIGNPVQSLNFFFQKVSQKNQKSKINHLQIPKNTESASPSILLRLIKHLLTLFGSIM